MRTTSKKFTIKKTTSVLILDNAYNFNSFNKWQIDNKQTKNELKAFSILLGEYNKFGRNINLEKHQELKEQFENIIDTIIELM